MQILGYEEEDLDFLIYGIPQCYIDFVKELKKTYPDVHIYIPPYEKAVKVKKLAHFVNYDVRYFCDNLPPNFDFEGEYYKYLKKFYKNTI